MLLSAPGYSSTMLRVWDIQTQTCTRRVHLDNGLYFSTMYPLGDSHVALWCDGERKIYLVDINNGSIVKSTSGKLGEVPSSLGSRTWESLGEFNFLAFSEDDHDISLWNLKSGELIHTFKTGWDKKLEDMVVSGDKSVMICTSQVNDEDGMSADVMAFDLKKKEQMVGFKREGYSFGFLSNPCTLSHDGKMFFHMDLVRNSTLALLLFIIVILSYHQCISRRNRRCISRMVSN